MATNDGIVRLSDFPRTRDRAVLASVRRDQAGEDDAAYDLAVSHLETWPATSLEGVKAKFELVRDRLADIEDGDELTPEGWDTMRSICESIDRGLARFTSRATG